jgi:hypothetical protein
MDSQNRLTKKRREIDLLNFFLYCLKYHEKVHIEIFFIYHEKKMEIPFVKDYTDSAFVAFLWWLNSSHAVSEVMCKTLFSFFSSISIMRELYLKADTLFILYSMGIFTPADVNRGASCASSCMWLINVKNYTILSIIL